MSDRRGEGGTIFYLSNYTLPGGIPLQEECHAWPQRLEKPGDNQDQIRIDLMYSFQLSGVDVEILYQDDKLLVKGEIPGLATDEKKVFSDDSIAKSGSDLGERMTVILLPSSRNGTSFTPHLILPKIISPSKDGGVAINGALIVVEDFSGLVGGAPPVLQHYDVRSLTGTMLPKTSTGESPVSSDAN